jgi:hypothetical protein
MTYSATPLVWCFMLHNQYFCELLCNINIYLLISIMLKFCIALQLVLIIRGGMVYDIYDRLYTSPNLLSLLKIIVHKNCFWWFKVSLYLQAYYGQRVNIPPYFNSTVASGHAPHPYMWGPPQVVLHRFIYFVGPLIFMWLFFVWGLSLCMSLMT